MSNLKIAYTLLPDKPLTEGEWLKEFKCGISASNQEGIFRAREMMNSWERGNKAVNWKEFVDRKLEDWQKSATFSAL